MKRIEISTVGKYLIAFLLSVFAFVLSEAIVSSVLVKITFATMFINILGTILSLGWTIMFLLNYLKEKKKENLILLVASLVMLISFLVSFIYSQVMLNAASGVRIFVTYVFPGVCFLNTYEIDGGIIGELISQEFFFFLPNFIVFICETITLFVIFFKEKNCCLPK